MPHEEIKRRRGEGRRAAGGEEEGAEETKTSKAPKEAKKKG